MNSEPTDQDDNDSETRPKKRKSPAVWASRIDAAKEQSKQSWDLCRMAWEEYLGPQMRMQDVRDNASNPAAARYPIYWSSVRSLQSMLYSRTPIPVAEKAFDNLDDELARVACLCLERLAKYLMRSCAFDSTMGYMRDTFIHYGKATCRIYFESKIREDGEKVYYIAQQVPVPPQQGQQPQDPNQPPQPPQMMTIYVNDRGEELQDQSQLQQDKQGQYFAQQPALDEVRVEVCPIHYRDYIHNPNARWEEEIIWKGYKSVLTKEKFYQKFGKVKGIKFTIPNENERTPSDSKNLKTPTANVWEVWDEENLETLWLAEGKKDEFLTPLMSDGEEYEGGDPYELDGFYPSPSPVYGTLGPDSLFPVPDYVQLRPFIDQLHGLADRLQVHVKALEALGIYDASVPGLKEAIEGLRGGQFKALQNFAELIDDGGRTGLEKIIRFFPMKEIADTVTQIMTVIESYEAKFNEVWGLPDILRGASNPDEGYQKQQQKGEWMSLRATVPGRSFQRVVRDAIELMCDLAIGRFPQQKLEDVMGVRYMRPEEQQLVPQVFLLIKDTDERKVRINIQTDSTISFNEAAELEQRNLTAKTMTDGFAAIAAAKQQDPDFVPAAIQALIDVVSATQKGKEMEGMLRALQKKKQQEMDAPPQPAPPDPRVQVEQMKQQGKQQEIQAKGQIDQQKMQGDFQIAQQTAQSDAQLEQMKIQGEMQATLLKIKAEIQQSQIDGSVKLQIEQNLAELEGKMKMMEMGMKMKEHTMDMAHESHSAALDTHQAATNTMLDVWNAKQSAKLEREKLANAYNGESK